MNWGNELHQYKGRKNILAKGILIAKGLEVGTSLVCWRSLVAKIGLGIKT